MAPPIPIPYSSSSSSSSFLILEALKYRRASEKYLVMATYPPRSNYLAIQRQLPNTPFMPLLHEVGRVDGGGQLNQLSQSPKKFIDQLTTTTEE